MGASRRSYWWEKLLHLVPGTTLWCPGYNRHFRWNKACFCADHLQLGTLLYIGGNRWLSIDKSWVTVEGQKPR